MKKTFKRIAAALLVAVMLFGSAPLESLTGIDFGGLFELEAEAYNISKDGHTASGVIGGQSVYITSNKANWFQRWLGWKHTIVKFSVGKYAEYFATSEYGKVVINLYEKTEKGWRYIPTENKNDPKSGEYHSFKENGNLLKNVGLNYLSGKGTLLEIELDKYGKDYRIDIIPYPNPYMNGNLDATAGLKATDIDDITVSINKGKIYDVVIGEPKETSLFNVYTGGESETIHPAQSSNISFYDLSNSNVSATSALVLGDISNSNSKQVTDYGIYLKANSESFTQNDIVWSSKKATTHKNISISETINNLTPNTKYYYSIFAKTSEGLLCSNAKSFITLKSKPPKAKISSAKVIDYRTKTEINSTEMGIGDSVSIKWNKADYADYYTISVNGVEDTTKIKGTSKVLSFDEAGTKNIKVRAHNSVGSGEWSDAVTVTVHPDVNITFYKDGNIYQQQTLTWGHDLVTMPELPIKKGAAFKGWYNAEVTSAISFKNIKDDLYAYAAYSSNKYIVKFVGPDGTPLSEQIVEHGNSAVEPSTEDVEKVVKEGRVFIGWNKDFSCIVEDTTVSAVTDAKNQNISVEITNVKAERYKKNYIVTCNVSNLTRADVENGRLVVAMKTSQGKLVTNSESSAYFLDANYTDINGNEVINSEYIKVIVPIYEVDKALNASVAEVYAIKDYQSLVPISSMVEVDVIEKEVWSNPTTEDRTEGMDEADWDSWVEYRSRELMLTTTTSAEERDRLVNEERWECYQTTEHKDKNSGTWTTKKPTSGILGEDYADRTVVDKKATTVYKYKTYRYWNSATGSYWYSYGRGYADSMGYSGKWYYKELSSPMSKVGTVDGYNKYDYSGDSYIWYSNGTDKKTDPKVNVSAVTHKEYRVFDTVYTYHLQKWPSEFSEWTRESVTETDTVDVETRDVFIYRVKDGLETYEDNDGEQRADEFLFDYLGEELAGKQVILAIYKINEASDWTLEHIDQTVVNDDGTYDFEPYKLREKLSDETGDFTVVLGLEGAEKPIYVDTIEAPKPEYTVTFIDDITGDVISTQTVKENKDAVVPEVPEHEGYTFSHWNNCSTNVKQNLEVRAMYDNNKYTVVWIDYVQEKYEIHSYNHGENLNPPVEIIPADTAEMISKGWDLYATDVAVPVTSNMVITAQYEHKTFTVDFLDFDGNVIDSQTVKYGETPETPDFDYEGEENLIFFGFTSKEEHVADDEQLETASVDSTSNETEEGSESENEESDFIIVEDYQVYNNCQITPEFEFINTTETPTIDLKTGTYKTAQIVTIECATENASIFYTLDGSDPKTSETAIESGSPAVITIEDSCQLRYYASAFNMNASAEGSEWYAINDGDETNKYIVKFAAYDDESVVYTAIAETGSLIDEALVPEVEGYTFNGAYTSVNITTDEETGEISEVTYSDDWNFETNIVTADTTLYLKYNVNTYNVEFVDYDGLILGGVQTVEYGDSATAPEAPVREGYVFTGWDTEDYITVTEDLTVNAVYVPEDEYVTIELNRSSYNMMSGNSYKLIATTGGNVENPEIIWASTDENVAVVDDNGVVTATGKGSAEIYAIIVDNGETATCKINVVGNPSDELTLMSNSYLTADDYGYIRGFTVVTDEDTQLHHAETVAEIKTQFLNNDLVFTSIDGTVLGDGDYVGTGTVITLMDGDKATDSIIVVVSGDMDGDGYVTNRDASRISRYLVDKETPTDVQIAAMDVNADGYVNNRDAALVSRYLVGKEAI